MVDQLERFSLTRRDLEGLDAEVSKFIRSFIPRITDTSQSNEGRLFLRVFASLIDQMNFSIDQSFRESNIDDVEQIKNALKIALLLPYEQIGVTAPSTDLDFTMLTGVAGSGGIPIPLFTIVSTQSSPVKPYITTEAATILEGGSSVDEVPAVQGTRVIDKSLTTSAFGDPDQFYQFPEKNTPHEFVVIKVAGTEWSNSLSADSLETSEHYRLTTDEDGFTTVVFGDGDFGVIPPSGAAIDSTYIKTLALDGNTPKDSIIKITGPLGATLAVVNTSPGSGGSTGEDIDKIKRNAPASNRAKKTAVIADDYRFFAEQVSGVHAALVIRSLGSLLNVYILPEGGGEASASLIADVQTELDSRNVEGSEIVVASLRSADLSLRIDAVLKTPQSKSEVRNKVLDTIRDVKADGTVNENGALYFKNLLIGRGFAMSDVSSLLENIDNGTLIDFINIRVLTRIPRVEKSRAGSVDFVGRISVAAPAEYRTWSIIVTDPDNYQVFSDGQPVAAGVRAELFTDPNGEVSFTLGGPLDSLLAGDSYSFEVSRLRDNLKIGDIEFMELERDSDLVISVFFPGEYDITAF